MFQPFKSALADPQSDIWIFPSPFLLLPVLP